MTERRSDPRSSKRFTVKFGVETETNLGFTTDLSRTGLFIKTTCVMPIGSPVMLSLTLPDDTIIHLKGTVVWNKKAPAGLDRIILKNGIGVRLQDPPSDYFRLLELLEENRVAKTGSP